MVAGRGAVLGLQIVTGLGLQIADTTRNPSLQITGGLTLAGVPGIGYVSVYPTGVERVERVEQGVVLKIANVTVAVNDLGMA
jgi:hypothetical protein